MPICEIKINPGRRKVEAKDVQDLAKSISQVGLLNPITVTPDHTLIAGNHRLEAAKLLEWTEIECTVCDVSGLLVELAEIDENFVRVNLSPIEFGDLLLRRKEIYEALHPEAKHGGDRKSGEIKTAKCKLDPWCDVADIFSATLPKSELHFAFLIFKGAFCALGLSQQCGVQNALHVKRVRASA